MTEADYLDLIADAFCQTAHFIRDEGSEFNGWYDTGCISTARDLGDCLVEAGLFERHPEGLGRRWFYRPVKKEATS
jgi:hypothetical protein